MEIFHLKNIGKSYIITSALNLQISEKIIQITEKLK